MQCTSPLNVGFLPDGKTLCFSDNKRSKEFAPFQLPCGKCLSCRLEKARQLAIRCIHEAQMHEKNCFITLTYSDENLKSNKLNYSDFQLFIKRLRDKIFRDYKKSYGKENWKLLSKEERKKHYEQIKIGVLGAGEYGDRTKRPHFHAIIFNWEPTDRVHYRTTDNGDKIYTSQTLEKLWGFNDSNTRPNEIGAVTFESAGYVARYATKKLKHGKDGEHDYEPISKRSSKNAIGKKWIEKYYDDVFNYGTIILPNGKKSGIPRYYENWYKKNHPEKWEQYLKTTKTKIIDDAIKKEEKTNLEEKKANFKRKAKDSLAKLVIKKNQVRKKLLDIKIHKNLLTHTKL